MDTQRYSVDEFRGERRRFELGLRAAGLKETSINTYIDRTSRFLKWLNGDYQPRGPNQTLAAADMGIQARRWGCIDMRPIRLSAPLSFGSRRYGRS